MLKPDDAAGKEIFGLSDKDEYGYDEFTLGSPGYYNEPDDFIILHDREEIINAREDEAGVDGFTQEYF